MGRSWSLGHPHPDHEPVVLGYIIGNPTGRNGGQRKGTALGCRGCDISPVLVSRKPPTGGGRADANSAYRWHLWELREECSTCGGRLAHEFADFDYCLSCGDEFARTDEPGQDGPEPGSNPPCL